MSFFGSQLWIKHLHTSSDDNRLARLKCAPQDWKKNPCLYLKSIPKAWILEKFHIVDTGRRRPSWAFAETWRSSRTFSEPRWTPRGWGSSRFCSRLLALFDNLRFLWLNTLRRLVEVVEALRSRLFNLDYLDIIIIDWQDRGSFLLLNLW